MKKIRTIEDLYNFCQANNLKMLSNYTSDFWEVYRANSDYFDRIFCRTYKSFVPYGLVDSTDDEELAVEWITDIVGFLTLNDKRYSELWRMQVLRDIDYALLDPYNVTETRTKSSTGNKTDNMGAKSRTKSNTLNYGATSTSDSGSTVHGAKSETDGKTFNYGQDKTVTEDEFNVGSQENSSENRVSAFNETVYQPKDLRSDSLGERQDTSTSTETRNSRSDSESGTHTEASYTDSNSNTRTTTAHTDTESGSTNQSAYEDIHSERTNENESVTKKGNMGIFSNAKLLSEHQELWQAFNFYKLIFDEIAEYFLRIIYF